MHFFISYFTYGISRSSRFNILPAGLTGIASRNFTSLIFLQAATWELVCVLISSIVALAPCLICMNATGVWPTSTLAFPTNAQCSTSGCVNMTS